MRMGIPRACSSATDIAPLREAISARIGRPSAERPNSIARTASGQRAAIAAQSRSTSSMRPLCVKPDCSAMVSRVEVMALFIALLQVRVRSPAALGDETINARREDRERYRSELKHRVVERSHIELHAQGGLRLGPGLQNRILAEID